MEDEFRADFLEGEGLQTYLNTCLGSSENAQQVPEVRRAVLGFSGALLSSRFAQGHRR